MKVRLCDIIFGSLPLAIFLSIPYYCYGLQCEALYKNIHVAVKKIGGIIMKGIILAGGKGSRLYPVTKTINKHLLPMGRYPMVYHAINKLKEAFIEEIMIVTSREHLGGLAGLLGSGKEMKLSFTYKVQDEAGGIAHALGLAEHFVGEDRMVVLLGDNIFSDSLYAYVDDFIKQKEGGKILIQKVKDPKPFGVAEIHSDRIISIEEKPNNPKSDYAVTGIYMFDRKVFDFIKTLKPSDRGELEIADVQNIYANNNELTYDFLTGWWIDAGTHLSYSKANVLAADINFDN